MLLGVAGAPTNSLVLAGWSAIMWTGAGVAGGSLSAQVTLLMQRALLPALPASAVCVACVWGGGRNYSSHSCFPWLLALRGKGSEAAAHAALPFPLHILLLCVPVNCVTSRRVSTAGFASVGGFGHGRLVAGGRTAGTHLCGCSAARDAGTCVSRAHYG